MACNRHIRSLCISLALTLLISRTACAQTATSQDQPDATVSEFQVEGALTQYETNAVLARMNEQFDACARARGEAAADVTAFRLAIARQGRVTSVSLGNAPEGDAATTAWRRCVSRVLLRARFPRRREESVVVVRVMWAPSAAMSALGALIGDQIGSNFGSGSLGARTGGTEPRGPVARVRTGVPVIDPPAYSAEVLRTVVRRHINELRYCYERARAVRPELAGRVVVRFTIAPDGAVSAAEVADDAVGDSAMSECIVGAVRRWSFPAPPSGGPIVVGYPLVLSFD